MFPKNPLGHTRVTALNVRVPSFVPTVGAKLRLKNTVASMDSHTSFVARGNAHLLPPPHGKYRFVALLVAFGAFRLLEIV